MTHLELAAKFRRSNTTQGTGIVFSHEECEMVAVALEAAAAMAAEHKEETQVARTGPLRIVPKDGECGGSCGRRPGCGDDS